MAANILDHLSLRSYRQLCSNKLGSLFFLLPFHFSLLVLHCCLSYSMSTKMFYYCVLFSFQIPAIFPFPFSLSLFPFPPLFGKRGSPDVTPFPCTPASASHLLKQVTASINVNRLIYKGLYLSINFCFNFDDICLV